MGLGAGCDHVAKRALHARQACVELSANGSDGVALGCRALAFGPSLEHPGPQPLRWPRGTNALRMQTGLTASRAQGNAVLVGPRGCQALSGALPESRHAVRIHRMRRRQRHRVCLALGMAWLAASLVSACGGGDAQVAPAWRVSTLVTANGPSSLYGTTASRPGCFAPGSGGVSYTCTLPGIAVDARNSVYVADGFAPVFFVFSGIMKVAPDGVATVFAGELGNGPPFTIPAGGYPSGLALDASGRLFMASTDNTVRAVSASGVITLLAGMGNSAGNQNGVGALATFNRPHGVAVDASGTVYVADTGNHKVRMISPDGTVTDFAGTGVVGSSDGPAGSAAFDSPVGVTVDADGNVYVSDSTRHTIRLITKLGMVRTIAGSGTAGFADGMANNAMFSGPSGIALDAKGNLYVADSQNQAIRVVSPAGMVTTLAGSPQRRGMDDGTGDVASFAGPKAVAVDSSGAVYVADEQNMAVRKLVFQ